MSRARDIANYGDGIDTASITSGTFADARIAQSNVTQHESAIDALGTIASGTFNGTIGSSATFPAGMLQGKSKNHIASGNINVVGQSTVISSNLDLTLTNCTAGSHFVCGFNSAMYNNGSSDDVEFDIITNIASGSDTIYPGGSAPPYGSMGTTRIQTNWTHRSQIVVLDSLGHSTGNSIRFRMQYLNRSGSSNTCHVCHNGAMVSFFVLEIK